MAIRGRDLYSRENEKIIDRQAIQSHQAFLEQVIDRITCVVIGDGYAMQTFGARRRNHIFGTGDTVSGKKGMCMQVDVKRHG
jgi:peroxiredoxin